MTGLLVPTLAFALYLVVTAAGGMLVVLGGRLFSLTAGWTGAATGAAVIAVALGGALGGFLSGRFGTEARTPVALLGAAAAAFGGAALLAPVPFGWVRSLYLLAWPHLGGTAAGDWALKLLLAVPVFSLPAALFFAMAPLLGRAIAGQAAGSGLAVGFGFGLTLAGTGLGVLASPLIFGSLGLRGATLVGTGLAGVGAGGLLLLRALGLEGQGAIGRLLGAEGEPVESAGPPEQGRLLSIGAAGTLGAAAALFGFFAWSAFVVWQRTLAFTLGPTLPGRCVAAGSFLLALALGCFAAAGLAMRLKRPMPVLVGLLAAAALATYGSTHLAEGATAVYLRLTPLLAWPGLSLLPAAVTALPVVLPAGVLIGAVLPLVPQTARARGRSMAGMAVYLALGVGLAQVAVTGAVIPAFGLRRAASLGCAVALLAAILFLGFVRVANPATRTTVTLVLFALMVALGGFPASWDPRIVVSGAYRYGPRSVERFGTVGDYFDARRRIDLLFYREGSEATVMVERTRQPVPGQPSGAAVALTVDGKVEAATGLDLRTQILLAHLPILVRGPAEDVLLVDFQTGVAAGSILRHPIRSLTIVEREPALLAAATMFAEHNHDPLQDGRVRVVHDTARSFLIASPESWDVIVVPNLTPWLPHAAALATSEGWAAVKARLREGGVAAQRLPLASAPEPALRTALRTFTRAFESVLAFRISGEDLLLLGSDRPLRLDVGWMKNVLGSRGEVSEDLRRILVLGPNELLLTFRAGEEALRGVLGDRPVDADDRALLETAATRALRPHDNEPLLAAIEDAWRPLLPRLENYGTLPAEQAEFLYNLAKSYLGYAGDPKRARDLAEALAGLGRDTLARWVIGECLLQERDIDGALAAWQALLAADPKNLDALFSLGMFHLDSRDYWQAEPFLSKAARLYPDTAVARYHLGRTLFYLGKNEAAIRELREAQRLSEGRETYPLVPYLVGIAAQKLNRHKEAAEALEAYLKWAYTQPLTRVEVDAHLKLADAYDSQGKRFQAHRERQKGEELRRRIETQAMQRGVEAVPPPPPAPPGATLDDSRVVGPSEDEPAAGGPGSPPSERP